MTRPSTDPGSTPERLAANLAATGPSGPATTGRSGDGSDRREPPVQDVGISISRDGTWWHQGTPFERPALVRLFSRVMRRGPDGEYLLVTPVERGRIEVEDAPFVALEMETEGEGRERRLRFRTNVDDWVEAGPERPIRVDVAPETQEPSPYVLVRPGLEALIARPLFYDLVELAETDAEGRFGIWAGGAFHELGTLEDEA